MATLILMRHANAELASPGMKDFDRPLSAIGWAEAHTAALMLNETGIAVTKVFCSPARRTAETLECLTKTIKIDASTIAFHHELYAEDFNSYQNVLLTLQPNDTFLCVGHNPMIEHFAFHLAKSGKQADLNLLNKGFPTAGIAIFDLGIFPVLVTAHGVLTHFLNPK